MISRELAILNEVPEGAYISNVVADSPAEKAGILADDIITKIDGKLVRDADGGLAKLISSYKPGQTIELTIYRGSETKILKTTLSEMGE
jgi:serine protease Do